MYLVNPFRVHLQGFEVSIHLSMKLYLESLVVLDIPSLYLDHNNLRWTIPPQLGELTNLKNGLGLSKNQLVGEIPSELGKLTLLRKLL